MNQTFKAVYFILKTCSTNDYLSHYKSFTAENFENSSLPKSLVITGHRSVGGVHTKDSVLFVLRLLLMVAP